MDYNTENNKWEATCDLLWDDVYLGHCWLVIKSNETWYDYSPSTGYESTDFDILPGEDDNGGGGNGKED
jgi:hypothetical protein